MYALGLFYKPKPEDDQATKPAGHRVGRGVHYSDLPTLKWGKTEQRLPAWMVERYGYEKARRIGVVAMVGGKNKTAIRNATPLPFRDLLLSIARQASND